MKRWKIDGSAAGLAPLVVAIAVAEPNVSRAESPSPVSSSFSREGLACVFIDPKDDMFAIMMMQSPSQRGRIETELKTLIYQALGK